MLITLHTRLRYIIVNVHNIMHFWNSLMCLNDFNGNVCQNYCRAEKITIVNNEKWERNKYSFPEASSDFMSKYRTKVN